MTKQGLICQQSPGIGEHPLFGNETERKQIRFVHIDSSSLGKDGFQHSETRPAIRNPGIYLIPRPIRSRDNQLVQHLRRSKNTLVPNAYEGLTPPIRHIIVRWMDIGAHLHKQNILAIRAFEVNENTRDRVDSLFDFLGDKFRIILDIRQPSHL